MADKFRKMLQLTPKIGRKKLEFSYFGLEFDSGSTDNIMLVWRAVQQHLIWVLK